jgi:hypothetical protein
LKNRDENMKKVLVYDLPSENQILINNILIKEKIRSKRVRAIQLLHSLGIPCTESVIIVPRENFNKIDNIVNRVIEIYNSLKNDNEIRDLDINLEPIIRVLDLNREQIDQLIPIAKRRLINTLDEAINRVNEILDSLNEITEESRRKRIIRNLRRLKNNWSAIFEIANRLGIDITRDYEYLINLIDSAL